MRIAIIGYCCLIAAATPAAVLAVDFDDVLRMLDANVSEESILRLIDEDDTVFVLGGDELIDLKDAGASDAFIEEMLDRSVDSKTPSRLSDDGYGDSYGAPGYSAYVSINNAYDPFDYYFASWPFYYGYVAPFRFSRAWWYYGGPYHWHWCDTWGYRTHYYNDRWGVRCVWNRGYRGQTRYHVPRYETRDKATGRGAYGRPTLARTNRGIDKSHSTWDREGRPVDTTEKRIRSKNQRETTRPLWGRGDSKETDRTPPSVRNQAPPSRVRPSPPGANPSKQRSQAVPAPRPTPRPSPPRHSR